MGWRAGLSLPAPCALPLVVESVLLLRVLPIHAILEDGEVMRVVEGQAEQVEPLSLAVPLSEEPASPRDKP